MLNEDFEAKVSNCGLAWLISDCKSHISTNVAGAIGYVSSKYGRVVKANERGDIYSFNVDLRELMIGK